MQVPQSEWYKDILAAATKCIMASCCLRDTCSYPKCSTAFAKVASILIIVYTITESYDWSCAINAYYVSLQRTLKSCRSTSLHQELGLLLSDRPSKVVWRFPDNIYINNYYVVRLHYVNQFIFVNCVCTATCSIIACDVACDCDKN